MCPTAGFQRYRAAFGRGRLAALTVGLACCIGLLFGTALATPAGSDQSGETASFAARLSAAAVARTAHRVIYDPAYVSMGYPMGDVAPDRGVCADVIIRAYRALGIDLQERVHQDMTADFGAYPKHWGLGRPDTNIDHRRVPNLETFFTRMGARLVLSGTPADYAPGDLVTWRLGGRLPHIGIVTDRRTADGTRPLVVHNVGQGPRLEDVLFAYPLVGHFRYGGDGAQTAGR